MGCTPSIHANRQRSRSPMPDLRIPYPMDDSENLQVYNVDIYDQKAIANLKREIKEDLDVFLLNNILLSVMFFENYDLEMAKAKNIITRREQEMSMKLMADHNKQCIMPDTAIELVNQRVRYRWRHGPRKNIEESVISQRMFVVHDTIEILGESEDLDHYSGIDKPTYRAYVQKSNHSGFVKLKHPDHIFTSSPKSSSSSNPIDNICRDNDIFPPTFDINQPSTSGVAGSSSSDEYDYAPLNDARTLRPINQTRSSSNSSGIPSNCLKSIIEKNLNHTDESKELFIVHRYFDSTEFMKHFANQVFPGELGASLGFDSGEIFNANYNARAIYCESEDELGVLKCEVIPAVVNPSPPLNVWSNRTRPIVKDLLKSIMYQWPTANMVQEIIKLPAVVVPRGCLKKREKNPDYNIEWEICYPKAEKFMHTRMSHAQMKCYLFMAILHKTFIEPVTQEKGLLLDHLRTLVYWECEKNFRDWPENRLGEKLLRILKILSQNMGRRDLRDYFNETKNVFENIPSNLLFIAQEKIHNICERPVMHFICALRNLTYSSGRFYPMLNFEELHKILTTKESMSLINPAMHKAHMEDRAGGPKNSRLNEEQYWLQRQIELNAMKRRRDEQNEQEVEKDDQPRASVDSIDLKWSSRRNVDSPKAVVFIKFFVEHFLKIAKISMNYYGATSQALLYLKQSWYLTKVMEDPMIAGDLYSRELQAKIQTLEQECKELSEGQALIPDTPARNSMNQMTAMQVQVLNNNTSINLNNISQHFQQGLQKHSAHVQKTTLPNVIPNGHQQHSTNLQKPSSSSWVEQNKSQKRNLKVRINSIVEHSREIEEDT